LFPKFGDEMPLKTDLLGREEDVCVVEVCGVGECGRTKFVEIQSMAL